MKNWSKRLLERYKALPRQLHHPSVRERSRAQRLIALSICVPLMLVSAGYLLCWHVEKARIEAENAAYSSLYRPAETPAETAEPTSAPLPTTSPTATPPVTSAPRLTPSPAPGTVIEESAPLPAQTALQATPAAASTAEAAEPTFEVAVDATLVPRTTPDADTLVYAIPTAPPLQSSFADLLALNPETVGFLSIGEEISLPVVQRKNDNSFYLSHGFDGEGSDAGTLFLDGSNLLVPEDDSLLIYGHNMRNGTMFHALSGYSELDFFKQHALVRFDTIYEDRLYVPFAAFTAAVEPDRTDYLDIRQFLFDEDSFDLFIYRMGKLSLYDSPVDVEYGDHILLLVTCEYTHDNGRFIVALRQLRDDETDVQMRELAQYTAWK